MTAKGKIQRIKCAEISTIGRNTQGVRIMRLKDDDTLATIVRVPRDELENEEGTPAAANPAAEKAPETEAPEANKDDDKAAGEE